MDNFIVVAAKTCLEWMYSLTQAMGLDKVFWLLLFYSIFVQVVWMAPFEIAQYITNKCSRKKMMAEGANKQKITRIHLGITFGILILRIAVMVFAFVAVHNIIIDLPSVSDNYYMFLGLDLTEKMARFTPTLIIPIIHLLYGLFESFGEKPLKKYLEKRKMKKTMSQEDYELWLEVEKDMKKSKKDEVFKVKDFLRFLLKVYPIYIFVLELGRFRYITLFLLITQLVLKVRSICLQKIQNRKKGKDNAAKEY